MSKKGIIKEAISNVDEANCTKCSHLIKLHSKKEGCTKCTCNLSYGLASELFIARMASIIKDRTGLDDKTKQRLQDALFNAKTKWD